MGSMLSFFVCSTAQCAANVCISQMCSCCGSATGAAKSVLTRLGYSFQFIFFALLAWIMGSLRTWIGDAWWFSYIPGTPKTLWFCGRLPFLRFLPCLVLASLVIIMRSDQLFLTKLQVLRTVLQRFATVQWPCIELLLPSLYPTSSSCCSSWSPGPFLNRDHKNKISSKSFLSTILSSILGTNQSRHRKFPNTCFLLDSPCYFFPRYSMELWHVS